MTLLLTKSDLVGHMTHNLEAAREAVAQGDLWEARHRLEGARDLLHQLEVRQWQEENEDRPF